MTERPALRDLRREGRTWWKLWDRLARLVFTLCGVSAVAVLLGIFVILTVNAARGFSQEGVGGGLSADEAALLTPEELAALTSGDHGPPSVFRDFLGDTLWNPDAVQAPRYGVLALVVSTFMTSVVSLLLAAPVGVATAAWLAFSAKGRAREIIKFGVEMLAALPSVVVGFVGIVVLGPLIGAVFGVPGGLNALNGSILLAIMALPTIVSLSEDALHSVPRSLIDASYALGADRWQTLVRVAAPAARSGLYASVMLGMGRAIGETMTVLMVCGNAPAMPHSVLDPVRTMTATIAIELGEVPRATPHYHMLFAVGALLFLLTLAVNLLADALQRRSQ